MKIIDLLNKIANGEKVPKKIKYKNIIWYFNKKDKTYYMNNTKIELFYIEKLTERLNDEVEIINDKKILQFDKEKVEIGNLLLEEKKIPEKLENEHEFYSYAGYEENKNEIDKVLYILKAINLVEEKIGNLNNSVNEIIDCLDYLKSKGE